MVVDLFGADIGQHARTAMGAAAAPVRCPVVITAELAIKS
ncbi:hypothetical protein FHT93_000094 [Rhizobium sp. BK379]|nr:hypothetical protein [Rhizobium sp. BK379]